MGQISGSRGAMIAACPQERLNISGTITRTFTRLASAGLAECWTRTASGFAPGEADKTHRIFREVRTSLPGLITAMPSSASLAHDFIREGFLWILTDFRSRVSRTNTQRLLTSAAMGVAGWSFGVIRPESTARRSAAKGRYRRHF